MHEPRDPDHKPGDGKRHPEDADNERRDAAKLPGGADGADGKDHKGDRKSDEPRDPDLPTDDEIEDAGCGSACAQDMSEGEPKAAMTTRTNTLMGSYVDVYGYSGEPRQ